MYIKFRCMYMYSIIVYIVLYGARLVRDKEV